MVKRNPTGGFSLMEGMMVVAIIGTVAMVAPRLDDSGGSFLPTAPSQS